MVYYRKYRPQKIDELDNASVRETLFSLLATDPPHAFLFTGPKGLGKTSTARIIAKVVNCTGREKGKAESGKTKEKKELHPSPFTLHADIEPCNKCEQCTSITNGTNMDILEIDAASNRGIDEIRDLKEKIRLSPMGATKKVYIIDEVHMLTTEAFNALLKTLEEPPEHAMFILCTTESQKVPATILSRCVHIGFTLATQAELVRAFKRITISEKIEIEDKALEMIAQMSEGGFRDGVKILEEVVSYQTGNKITAGFVEEKYQVASIKGHIESVLDSLSKKNAKEGLLIISKIIEQGVDIKYFIQQLIEELHLNLLTQIGVMENKSKRANYNFTTDETRVMFNLLTTAYSEMKNTVIEQLPLELAIISWCGMQAPDMVSSPSEISYVDMPDNTLPVLRKQVGNIAKVQAMYGAAKKEPAVKVEQVKDSPILLDIPANGEVSKEWIELFWKNIILEMKKYNHTIAGVLRGCQISEFDKKILVIQTSFTFHKERLDDMKTMTQLSQVCKMLTGKDIKIEVQLKSR